MLCLRQFDERSLRHLVATTLFSTGVNEVSRSPVYAGERATHVELHWIIRNPKVLVYVVKGPMNFSTAANKP